MKIIFLNHKMNLYYEQLDEYLERINKINKNLIIAPSNIYLLEFIKRCHHKISCQDVCYLEDGNYTGKVSWHQMKSLGVKYVIIGHSEKNDTIDKINAKLTACLENGLTPILCFGNHIKEENPLETLKQINNLNPQIIYAYEALYGIGNTINTDEIISNINDIYSYLYNKIKQKPIIIYGGGINENNINTIYHIDKLSGILIGSKSADINSVETILNNILEK